MKTVSQNPDDIKEDMVRNPEVYAQPKLSRDFLTGKDRVDKEFVDLYGNPYNEKNKHEEVIEDRPEPLKQGTKGWEEVQESMAQQILEERARDREGLELVRVFGVGIKVNFVTKLVLYPRNTPARNDIIRFYEGFRVRSI